MFCPAAPASPVPAGTTPRRRSGGEETRCHLSMKQTFNVSGMTCSACSAHVEKAVCKLEGVRTVQVNLLSNSMQVEYDEGVLSAEGISSAVGQAGYAARPAGAQKAAAAAVREDPMAGELDSMKRRMAASFCFLLPLF